MKRKIIITITLFFLLTSILSAFAEVSFWQTKEIKENGVIQNHLVASYSKGGYGFAEDYISGNNPYEIYLLYNIYIKTWNKDNPDYKIDNCSLIIKQSAIGINYSYVIYNKTYTEENFDIKNAKYFIRLNEKTRYVFADIYCVYNQFSNISIDIPAEMQLITPSWECKACQQYEWTLIERSLDKAQTLGNNISSVMEYIKKLFLLNFEILLALFWVFMILMIFVGVSFIFFGIYWLFIYLRRIAK